MQACNRPEKHGEKGQPDTFGQEVLKPPQEADDREGT